MIRLFEGVYPPTEAGKRLAVLKQTVDSAFVLRHNGELSLYAGSYHDPELATRFVEFLRQQQINVTEVVSEVEMTGEILTVTQVGLATANEIKKEMEKIGLSVDFSN